MTEKMKPSGIAWIGHIPNEWGCKQIAFMADSRSGGTPDRNNLTYWENGTIPWMSSGEVNKVNVYETDEKITELATRNSSAKIVKANAVMVALNGQGKTKGMSAILRIDSACNQSLCAFSCHEGILHYEYLFWCFQTMYTYLRQMSGDDVRDGLAASYVKKQKIPVPEYEEQCAIADFLDTQCAKIDSVIVDIEKQIETLQKYKKSLITETVTKGLDRSVPMKDSGFSWIGQIPDHWEICRIKDTCSLARGGSPRPINEYLSDNPNDLNWIRIGDTTKGSKYIVQTEQKIIRSGLSNSRLVHEGDLLLTNSMSFGQPYILKISGCIHDGWLVFSDYSKIDKLFLYYVLMSDLCYIQFKTSVAGAVVENLSIDKVGASKIYVPPIEEQMKIVEFLDTKCQEIDEILGNKEKQLDIIKQHKKSLIYEYVTGKKRVTEVN